MRALDNRHEPLPSGGARKRHLHILGGKPLVEGMITDDIAFVMCCIIMKLKQWTETEVDRLVTRGYVKRAIFQCWLVLAESSDMSKSQLILWVRIFY